MEIEIFHFIEGAKKARGSAVIIDVFRAFTTACFVMSLGARGIIPVGDIRFARLLKKIEPELILMGERDNVPPADFEFGNSPAAILRAKDEGFDFEGKLFVHTTSAGTQGLVNAKMAGEIMTGALVNARATVSYLLSRQSKMISLVCMGENGRTIAYEDLLCAKYMKSLLLNLPVDEAEFAAGIEQLKNTTGKRFFEPSRQIHEPERDFILATSRDIFDFVLVAVELKSIFPELHEKILSRLKTQPDSAQEELKIILKKDAAPLCC